MRYLHQYGSKTGRGKTLGSVLSIWYIASLSPPQSCIELRRASLAPLTTAPAMCAPGRNHDTDESHTIREFQNGCRSTHLEFVPLPTHTERTPPFLPPPMTYGWLGILLYWTGDPIHQQIDARFLPSRA